MRHPDSRLWMDVVDTSIVDRRLINDGVRGFLDGMEELGESFIYGLDDPAGYLTSMGYGNACHVTSGSVLNDPGEVFDTYSFVVAGPAANGARIS